MITLFRKEISQFFSSLTGPVVIILFLITTGLFIWVFPGSLNIPENGYATLDPLFTLAPWVFLFLIPAITMKLISEEKQSGTIDLLFTKPLSDFQIVFAKYLAGLLIVLLSLLPTLVFYYSVYQLGQPQGNLDVGGTWGSFLGLFFLAAIYVAVGLFGSVLSKNQIIGFLLAVLFCFFLYIGFDHMSSLFTNRETLIMFLGIHEHYESISRGVIDSRDLIYFISVIAIFLFSTKMVMASRKW